MAKPAKHKWTFSARFRSGAYSWKASKLASMRIREAVSEIKKAGSGRPDPLNRRGGPIYGTVCPGIPKAVPEIRELGVLLYLRISIQAPPFSQIRVRRVANEFRGKFFGADGLGPYNANFEIARQKRCIANKACISPETIE